LTHCCKHAGTQNNGHDETTEPTNPDIPMPRIGQRISKTELQGM